MTLNGVMAVTLRNFTEFGKPALQKTICSGIYARVYCILSACTMLRRKESSRSLSHLLMSFLFILTFSSFTVHKRTEKIVGTRHAVMACFDDVYSWTVISPTAADFEAILTATSLRLTTAQVAVRQCSERMTTLNLPRCIRKLTTTRKITSVTSLPGRPT